MSKVLGLRALVNERLTAAAEEIFALVERTIAEYEEELCRFKDKENQRKLQLMSVLRESQSRGHGAGVQINWFSPEPSANEEIPETPQIKEEQGLKQEEEQLPEFTGVCVKSEEQSSLLQRRQSEHRELTQGEHCGGAGADISLDPHGHLHSEEQTDNSSDTDNDEDWELAASSSTAQMETEADGNNYNQVNIKDTNTAAHNLGIFSNYKCGAERRATDNEGHMSGAEGGGGDKKYECIFCQKRFKTKQSLERHSRSHTGEKPYSCPVCKKTFAQKGNLNTHIRIHTGEKPYSCSFCGEMFTFNSQATRHMKIHRRHFFPCVSAPAPPPPFLPLKREEAWCTPESWQPSAR